MTFLDLFIFFIVIQVIHFAGTWKLYLKAGRKSWEALIPIYNALILMKIINRPWWWTILLFIPIINLLVFPVIWVETLRSFKKNSSKDTLLGVVTFGFYIAFVNHTDSKLEYVSDRSLKPRTALGEWISAVLFAVVAATLVHTYAIQPYIIPTGSLEKTLLIGDFLFVSKYHYGARSPMTAISFPMVHDTIPIVKKRSYLKKPQLPYFRLPRLQKIKRNNIVVFNWPADTVRRFFVSEKGVKKPIDKKSNYVKRCVGIAGDTLEIVDGFVYIDGKKTVLPDRAKPQYAFRVYKGNKISSKLLLSEGIKNFTRTFVIKNLTQQSYNALIPYMIRGSKYNNITKEYTIYTSSKGIPIDVVREWRLNIFERLDEFKTLTLTLHEAEDYRKKGIFDSIVQQINRKRISNTHFFPNDIRFNWNEDNFGPIVIPKRGMTVELTDENVALYKKIIREYEVNTLVKKGGDVLINGKKVTQYTFKMDYFWMMGDNRHQSEDSRFWGFVPENHIVGKPVLIWFSINGINDGIRNWKIRWDRLMTTVDGEGKPTSFFPYVVGILIFWQGFVIWKRRKKKNAA